MTVSSPYGTELGVPLQGVIQEAVLSLVFQSCKVFCFAVDVLVFFTIPHYRPVIKWVYVLACMADKA